jgi:hypothetical protein
MTPQLTVLAGEERELTNSGGINAFLETAAGAIFKKLPRLFRSSQISVSRPDIQSKT